MKYGKAPIQEALIDIRVEPRPESSPVDLARLFEAEKERFPVRQELGIDQTNPEVLLPTFLGGVGMLSGFRFASADKQRVVQVRRDVFAFSLLPPYDCWEGFSGEALELWKKYRDFWQPVSISRVAVRYINRFEFSDRPLELPKFFRLYPHMPRETPTPFGMDRFGLQAVIPQPDIKAVAIVNEVAVPPRVPGNLDLVLDIDVFKEGLSLNPFDDEDLEKHLNDLRYRKNAIFEESITADLKERIL